MNMQECSGRSLAFLGDAVWSLLVRRYLLESGQGRGDQLQRLSVSYVSARAQAGFYAALHAEGFFTAQEEEVFRRGRNSSAGSVPRNTPVALYRASTGFEAMLGALCLNNQEARLAQIWEHVRTLKEENHGTIGLREKCCKADSH